MPKRLVITEKPSVARDIVRVLGGFDDHEEYYESDRFLVTWAVGHLLQLAEPEDYDKALRSWSIKNLPIIPEDFQVKPRDGQKQRIRLIQKLGRRKDVEGTINACDAGREGEIIFRRIVEFTGLDDKPIYRLWLQSMTDGSILDAFRHLRPGEELQPLADAAWLRSVGDWLIGMNATRALTQRLKSRGEKGAWSAGRVQTPTLALLVEREREILAHVPVPYWVMSATFQHGEHSWQGRYWDKEAKQTDEHPDRRPGRLFDEQRVTALVEALGRIDQGLASETRRKSTQKPPLPFDLTSLQREANRRFSYSAKRTLDSAQRLYERYKALTYPRTDSRYLPDDYGPTVDEVLGALSREQDYADLADGIRDDGPQNLDRVLDGSKVSDHFAIVPTGTPPEGELSPGDAKIYDLVVRQFMASLMKPAIWSNVERLVEVAVGDETVTFRATGRTLEVPGFQAALLSKEALVAEEALPALVPGQNKADDVAVGVGEVASEAKETRPPGRYSEAALLRVMETAGEQIDDDELSDAMRGKGLGTPATRADTIEGLVRKGYARRSSGKLAPTSKAMRLMDVLERVDVPVLASPKLTGEWEHNLSQVQAGELTRTEMLATLADFTREVTDALTTFDHDAIYAAQEGLGTCPNCGEGTVRETAWGYPCSRNTDRDAPCNFMIWKDRGGRYVDRELVRKLIEQRRVGPIGGFFDRQGRELTASIQLVKDEEKGRWVLDLEYGESADPAVEEVRGDVICVDPTDPDERIVETNLRYVSTAILDKKKRSGPVLPKVVCHREIGLDEAKAFFSDTGKTETLEGFISKRGRPFRGALFRKPTGKHGFEFPPREPKKKAPAKKSTATAKKAPAKKATATAKKKAPAKKAPAKKSTTTAKKAPAKKAPARRRTTKKDPDAA